MHPNWDDLINALKLKCWQNFREREKHHTHIGSLCPSEPQIKVEICRELQEQDFFPGIN